MLPTCIEEYVSSSPPDLAIHAAFHVCRTSFHCIHTCLLFTGITPTELLSGSFWHLQVMQAIAVYVIRVLR
jgi:hypothetical protein